jgi:DNA-binding protein HU-beta
MNKRNLADVISLETGLKSRECESVMDSMIKNIIASLKSGDEVTIAGFGKFYVKQSLERKVINPRTKQVMVVPATKKLVYRINRNFKKEIKG